MLRTNCTLNSAFVRYAKRPPANILSLLILSACTAKNDPQIIVTPQVIQRELFVTPAGLDSNDGSRCAPLRTLARAAKLVTPGTTVYVLPGFYPGGFRTTVSGFANARIIFHSTVRWGARIVPPLVSTRVVAWENEANYVDIEGFDIDGRLYTHGLRWTAGIYSSGSNNRITGNRVRYMSQ
jgi:hypothetical protein